jgi:hypothetical protein
MTKLISACLFSLFSIIASSKLATIGAIRFKSYAKFAQSMIQ